MTRRFLGVVVAAAFTAPLLAGCYQFGYLYADRYTDWPEQRVKRSDGELVAKVQQKNGRRDNYEVLVRWPTGMFGFPRDISHATREKEGRKFLATLCGKERTPHIYLESLNDRMPEIYYDVWCRPKAK